MARRNVMVVVATAWLATLGCSSRWISGRDGGAAGTGAAGSDATNTGAAGTGAAGTAAAGTGAAGTAAAGTGGGAAGSSPTCGGNLLGAWAGSDPDAHPAAPVPPADPCYELSVERNAEDGTFTASCRWPAPQQREVLLELDAGRITVSVTQRGPVTVAFAASCLSKTTPRPTCTQLAEALLSSGLGEGNVRAVDCAAAGGGCTCTSSIIEASGSAGTYTAGSGLLTATLYPGTQQEKKVATPYCVDGKVLRLGTAADGIAAGLSRITFEPHACEDGKKNGVEQGIDCGGFCPDACP